jgi:hypothetical protein
MHPENVEHFRQKIYEVTDFISTPEAINFDDSQLWDKLSPQTQQVFTPIRQEFRIHNACLDQVSRWQGYPYQQYLNVPNESDFDHILGMLEIFHQLKKLGLSSFDDTDIEIKTVIHDSGEIITGDVPLFHFSSMNRFAADMKKIESRCFLKLVLGTIKETTPNSYLQLKNAYTQYQNRNDKGSHLVKYIDNSQGNEHAVIYIYKQSFPIMSRLPINPYEMIESAKENENQYLGKILAFPTISDSDKQILFEFTNGRQTRYL